MLLSSDLAQKILKYGPTDPHHTVREPEQAQQTPSFCLGETDSAAVLFQCSVRHFKAPWPLVSHVGRTYLPCFIALYVNIFNCYYRMFSMAEYKLYTFIFYDIWLALFMIYSVLSHWL